MKKVLVFGITDLPGGVESVIMNYYRNIDRNKIQFDFLCNTEKVAYEEEIKELGGTIYRITARSKNYKKYKKEMKDFFENHSKEYSTIWVNICSLANIDYLKYAKKYGIEYRIIHCHNSQNMDSFLRGLLHRWNRLLINKYATDFWSCSDDASKWFYNKKIIQNDKYLVIKNAINLEKFKYNEKIRNDYRKKMNLEDCFVVGHVGRFHFQKNHKFLIKIFNEIHKKNKKAMLLLIGEGQDEKEIKEMVKHNGIEKYVKFLGPRKDVSELMQAMDVFVFPSVFEGLGVVLIEAQASGLPIYASSNVIPNEVEIIKQNFNFLSLNYDELYWADTILKDFKEIKYNRVIDLKLIENCGYNIKKEEQKIEKFFTR